MFDLEPREFNGITVAHLDAFEERKWSSHRFGLERMRAAGALAALERRLSAARLGETEGLAWIRTDPTPGVFNGHRVDGLWLYLERTGSERSEVGRVVDREISLADTLRDPHAMHRFAFVGVRLDQGGLCVGFWLHSRAVLDRRNLAAALDDPMERSRLPVVLEGLPEGATVSMDGCTWTPAQWADGEAAPLSDLACWFRVALSWDRDAVVAAGAELADAVAAALPGLVGLYRYAAWSPGTDRLGLARKLKEERKERVKKATGLKPGDSVEVIQGLLSGQRGEVAGVDARGRVKLRIGLMSIDMDPKTVRKL
ncbi:MAG: hypothetical protein ABIK09_09240 [Pseudomonadota bacterium]